MLYDVLTEEELDLILNPYKKNQVFPGALYLIDNEYVIPPCL
jgi:hypothetical protein